MLCCWSRSQMRRAGAIGSGVVPSAAGVGVRPDGSQAVGRRGSAIAHRDGGIGHRDGRIGRTSGYPDPFMRRLTPQVVAQAGRPHCHLSGPAAQERVTTTSVTTTSKGTQANIPRPARRITELMYRRCPHEDASRCYHLLYRLSRTRKPKSRATSNTQCPITRCVGVRVSHAVTGVRWCERPSGCRFSSWSSSSASRRPARRRR